MIRAEIPTRGGPGDWRERRGVDHYQTVLDFIESNSLSFSAGCAVSHICSYERHGNVDDLMEARLHIERMLAKSNANA